MSNTERKQRQSKPFNQALLQSLRFFDAVAASHYAPIAPRTFYQAIADGKLRASRIGGTGRLVVRRNVLDRYIAGTPVSNHLDEIADAAVAEVTRNG